VLTRVDLHSFSTCRGANRSTIVMIPFSLMARYGGAYCCSLRNKVLEEELGDVCFYSRCGVSLEADVAFC